MSMSLTNAKTYVARAVGGAGDSLILSRAEEALGAAMEEFSQRNDWSFLRIDTAQSFAVASCTIAGDGVSVTVAAGGFNNVLKGMTVTGTGVPASTTVSVRTSATAITLSAASTPGTVTLTFGGTIPIIQGTDQYLLPTTFWKPYSCRLTSASKTELRYIPQAHWDRVAYDETSQGTVTHYTIYNGADFDASGTQQAKIKFFRVPAQNDVALLRYYRPMDITKTTLDVDDQYLYTLLTMARAKLLEFKNATDERLPIMLRQAEMSLRRAIASDRNEGGEDEDEGFKAPGEFIRGVNDVGWPRGDGPWWY